MKGRWQGSFSGGGTGAGGGAGCMKSWDEGSRKGRRCLTVGGEGEDSGCQIGSPRLWNRHHSSANTHARTHTHALSKQKVKTV